MVEKKNRSVKEVIQNWREKSSFLSQGMIEKFIKEKSFKTATSGTVKLFLRQGLIQSLPKGTTVGMLSHIIFVFVENTKVVKNIYHRKIPLRDGMEDIGQRSLSLLGGLLSIGNGTLVGGALGGIVGMKIPILGNWSILLGGFVGSAFGYALGSKLGHLLFFPLKKIYSSVIHVFKDWHRKKK